MFVFIIIVIALLAAGFSTCKADEFYRDYMAPKNTASVNGIFSILIFISHATQYIQTTGVLDKPYMALRGYLGQLVVVTYLFFSGYGIMESIKKKQMGYVKSIPSKRLFRLWYHFAIVIVMFLGLGLLIGKDFTLNQVLLSFTGMKSLGNSNWYMFVTFALYIIVFISFFIFRKHHWLGVIGTFVLTAGFVLLERELDLTVTFYNTIFCFPVGMLFSMVKPYWDKLLMKNDVCWFSAFALIGAAFMYFADHKSVPIFTDQKNEAFIHYSLFAIFFGLLVTLLMMKTKVESSVLDWFGQHIFSFFILQRIPMIFLDHINLSSKPMVFIVCSFIGTVTLAVIFDKCIDKLDSLIFRKREKA